MLASHRSMLKAMVLLCFKAFLRMGEICLKSGCSSDLIIQRHDLSFMYDAGKVTGVTIVIKNYKNNLKQLPVTLFLPPNIKNVLCCPVKALLHWCTEYTHTAGPLFQFQNCSAVSYAFIADKLRILIKFLGLDHNRYKPHSFRIGAAASAYCQGRSEDDIKCMGR